MAEFLELVDTMRAEEATASRAFRGEGVRAPGRGGTSLAYQRRLAETAQLIAAVLRGNAPSYRLEEAMSRDDFPILFGDIMDRQLLAVYREAPQSYRSYCKVARVKDFREKKYLTFGGADAELGEVPELNEYPEAALNEAQKPGYRVRKFGRRIPFSWEARVNDYLDVQISLDGLDALTNDAIRGTGSFALARGAMDRLAARGFRFKLNTVLTRHNFSQLDALYDLANGYGAELRVTRLRPSGRGAATWRDLHPTLEQSRALYEWLHAHPDVATGDSWFHLSALGEPLPGMGMCGAGRIVCLVDPLGDVYACPFTIDPRFRSGNIVRDGSFANVWRGSTLFTHLREWEVGGACRTCGAFGSCHGGCMAVKHFTGVSLDDRDPECVLGHGTALPLVRT
jgi:mycofactocin radical SAM maturase